MATGRKTMVVGQVIDPGTWGNPVWDQSVQTFASAADRTAQFATPLRGAVTWLDDVARLEVWTGTAWRTVPTDVAGTYVPVLSGITLGNGTVAGRWWTVGHLLMADVIVTWGSTTTSTNPMGVKPPPDAVAASLANSNVGDWTAWHPTVSPALRAGWMAISSGGTALCRNADGTGIGGSTNPFAWAAGCTLIITFKYPLSSLPAFLAAIAAHPDDYPLLLDDQP